MTEVIQASHQEGELLSAAVTENFDSAGRKEIYLIKQEVRGKAAPGFVYLVAQQCHQKHRFPTLASLEFCSQGCFPRDCYGSRHIRQT